MELPLPLPQLRQELKLLPALTTPEGEPRWTLHDPLSGRYFQLGLREVEILAQMERAESAAAVAQAATHALQQPVAVAEVEEVWQFLRHHSLVIGDPMQQQLYHRQRSQRSHWFTHLAKSYLFIRIPLWNPDRFLERWLPQVAGLAHPAMVALLGVSLLLGGYLTARQWDTFLATLVDLLTPAGVLGFGIALIGVKILHELGHAFVAKAHGCRVAVIGVALLVLWPVLYTDTTAAWQLPSRRARIQIAIAGMAVELAVAVVALLLWSVAEEGAVRTLLFILATTTWMVSLLVNLNPLMRFDGYYLFADALNLPNLEQRSHAVARWWLRERLFGWQQPPPEPFRYRLLLFAVAVWIYRFLLFFGIALLVYHLFFKLLGLLLFWVEIGYFILGPLYREGVAWYRLRHQLRLNGALFRTVAVLLLLLGLLLLPWQRDIEIPAQLSGDYQPIYAPLTAQITAIPYREGESVAIGDRLLLLTSPALIHEATTARLRQQELQLQRRAASLTPQSLDQTLVIQSELQSQQRLVRQLEQQLKQLDLVAPQAGQIIDYPPDLRVGSWVREGERLLSLLNSDSLELIGYLKEGELARVEVGLVGAFYPDGLTTEPLPVQVTAMDRVGSSVLTQPLLASLFGGEIAVRYDETKQMVPLQAIYRLRFAPMQPQPPQRILRGRIHLAAAPESILEGLQRRLTALWLRERGF